MSPTDAKSRYLDLLLDKAKTADGALDDKLLDRIERYVVCDHRDCAGPTHEEIDGFRARLTPEAKQDVTDFSAHLCGHKGQRVDGCRFCDKRASKIVVELDPDENFKDAMRAGGLFVANELDTLRRAVNASTNECLPGCSRFGHEGDCPACDPARWLVDQQKEIASLRAELVGARDAIRARVGAATTDALRELDEEMSGRTGGEILRSLAKTVLAIVEDAPTV